MADHDEWYLDQPVRVPGKDASVRVLRLTKTLVHLADGSRWRRCDGRPHAHASTHIEPWSAEHTRSAELARRKAARVRRHEPVRAVCVGLCDPPPVCPGCYAVGEEPCLSWCIDAQLDEERRYAIETGDYDCCRDEEEDA